MNLISLIQYLHSRRQMALNEESLPCPSAILWLLRAIGCLLVLLFVGIVIRLLTR